MQDKIKIKYNAEKRKLVGEHINKNLEIFESIHIEKH